MKHLNSETLKNITDTMQRERKLKVGEIHPNTGLPIIQIKKTNQGKVRAFLVRMAARRMSKGRLENQALDRFHKQKR